VTRKVGEAAAVCCPLAAGQGAAIRPRSPSQTPNRRVRIDGIGSPAYSATQPRPQLLPNDGCTGRKAATKASPDSHSIRTIPAEEANPPVIPTGEKRSGGICCFSAGSS
jgi:hypothetical protein